MTSNPRRQHRRRGLAGLAAVATIVSLVATTARAEVPTIPEPITYDKSQAIQDPGLWDPNYFSPLWYDTDGRHIQAHGGQVVTATQLDIDPSQIVEGTDHAGKRIYFWYGEDRSNGYYLSPGVSAYSSYDGFNWKNEGVAMRSVQTRAELTNAYFDSVYDTVDETGAERTELVDALFYNLNVNPVAPDGSQQLSAIFERPKVLYNEADDTWVMWWHADGKITPGGSNYARSMAAVAVSDSPTGPFKLTGSFRLYNRANYKACNQWAVPGQARDMTVFKDTDGTAYVVYSSEENASLYMTKLDEHYTNVEKTRTTDSEGIQYSADGRYPYIFADGTPQAPVRGVDFQIVRECGSLESPAVFTYDDRYYVVTSGTTGWAPNQNTYYSADSLLGPWIRGIDPSDAYELSPYNNIPEGGDGRISINDSRKTTFGSQSTDVFEIDAAQGKFVYMGDRWADGEANSTYVWLPIVIGENGRLMMHNPAVEDPAKWGSGWDASYWDTHGAGPWIWNVTDDRLPDTVTTGEWGTLPTTVAVSANGSTKDVAVTWDTRDLMAPGTRTITGSLAGDANYTPGRTFTRTITVDGHGLYNIAPEATASASSRSDLAWTTNDAALKAKGWDDWVGGGQYPKSSWLSYAWVAPRVVESVTVHTYKDGPNSTWPSQVSVQYLNAAGAWTTAGEPATVSQSGTTAPEVKIDLPEIPATTGIRVLLTTATNVWQSISEVEIFGYAAVECGAVTAPWVSAAWGDATRAAFCQNDGSFRISDNNRGSWTDRDLLSVIRRDAAVTVGDSIVTTVAAVDGGANSDPRAGLVLRNDLSKAGAGSSDGYVILSTKPGGVFLQWDANGNGYVDTESAITTATVPVELKLTYTSATEATGYYRAAGSDTWIEVGKAPLTDAATTLDAGIFGAGNNNLGTASFTFEGTAIVKAATGTPTATPSQVPTPTVTATVTASTPVTATATAPPVTATSTVTATATATATVQGTATATATTTATATATATVTAPGTTPTVTVQPSTTVKPTPPAKGDLYSTPGFHSVGGRWWHTECEPYSQTVRCRTEIWATQITQVNGKFVSTTGWVFNNLTYLPFMTRTQWGTNPLANTGEYTINGRQWKTECDTALTGIGGCRSSIKSTYITATPKAGGGYTYAWTTGWVVNNLVRFKA